MNWDIKHQLSTTNSKDRLNEILALLYEDRELKSDKSIKSFLNPPSPLTLTPKDIGLKPDALTKATEIIKKAIATNTPILIFGDYDADGITATAILWETLHKMGASTLPFIPDRKKHGYGLSENGLKAALTLLKSKLTVDKNPLIITVDNGITATKVAKQIKEKKHQLIISDHHQPGDKLPKADAILHTTAISGAGVSWMLAKALDSASAENTLDLLTIGTVADIMPLIGPNRSIVSHGLRALQHTKRPGLKAICKFANIDLTDSLSTYHIGYIIGPRINAMGRLSDATQALRLLLTKNTSAAHKLAQILESTNASRQDLTQDSLKLAHQLIKNPEDHLLVVAHKSFHEGIIGLIAGKLTETYHRPSIAIALDTTIAKGSARSIKGVNIIEMIQTHQKHLISAGGHPQAAGLSLKPDDLESFINSITSHAQTALDKDALIPTLSIDILLRSTDINWQLYDAIENLAPFGVANPRPTFALEDVSLTNTKLVGRNNTHLKTTIVGESGEKIDAIGFNLADQYQELERDIANVAFTLSKNTWNGNTKLQLSLKQLK